MDTDARMRLADEIFSSLDGTPAVAVRLFARALRFSSFSGFATAFDYYADSLEPPATEGRLAQIKLALDLRRVRDYDALLKQLEGATEPPWPAIRDALTVLSLDLEADRQHTTEGTLRMLTTRELLEAADRVRVACEQEQAAKEIERRNRRKLAKLEAKVGDGHGNLREFAARLAARVNGGRYA